MYFTNSNLSIFILSLTNILYRIIQHVSFKCARTRKVSTQYILPEGFDIEEVQFALVMLVQVQEEEYKVITISKETSKVINESELISSYNLYKSALIKYELGIGAYAEMLSNVYMHLTLYPIILIQI